MAEGNALGTIDSIFNRIGGYITKQISIFVAFLFFLFTAGSVYGAYVFWRQPPLAELWIIGPALLGLLAYYNRSFAIVMFVSFLLLFFVI